MKAIAILVGVCVVMTSAVCLAGQNRGYVFDAKANPINANVKFALHLLPHATKGCGKLLPSIPDFGSIVRTWSSYDDVDAFMVIFDYDSISVYEYNLLWPAGWGSTSTQICLGSGVGVISVTDTLVSRGIAMFFDCKASGTAGAPAFLPVAYHWFAPISDGEIEIWPNLDSGNLGVVDCRPDEFKAEQYPVQVYYAGVNVDPYEGPPLHSTEPTSWGHIKSLFR